MKKIIISAIMGIMAVCGMAQEKVYVHKMDGTAVAFDISEVAEINFVAPEEPESTAPEGVEFVQLYENGPKWANMNIGASSVTDAGLYFWWGDVQGHAKDESPKFNFDSDNVAITSWGNNEGYVADGKLVAEKDAATQLWGAGYRMPTQAEFEDLYNKCTWTWKTNYNGVDKANGYLVQGKGEYASYSIFIPAAGYRIGEDLYYEGSIGYYWSSTPDSGNADSAYDLYFDSDYVDPLDYYARYLGFPVRPVSEL